MTKTEEALCNGITFSVPRMVPTAIQEGELDNALYYVIVYLTPNLDKLVFKFYEAPSYIPLKWEDKDIECIRLDLERLENSDGESSYVGYNFGYSGDGQGYLYPGVEYVDVNRDEAYNGLTQV